MFMVTYSTFQMWVTPLLRYNRASSSWSVIFINGEPSAIGCDAGPVWTPRSYDHPNYFFRKDLINLAPCAFPIAILDMINPNIRGPFEKYYPIKKNLMGIIQHGFPNEGIRLAQNGSCAMRLTRKVLARKVLNLKIGLRVVLTTCCRHRA